MRTLLVHGIEALLLPVVRGPNQMYVSCCLANLYLYKNPVNYLLFRARNYYSTALSRSNVSHELTVNSQARATGRDVPVSTHGQNILPSDHENTCSLSG